MSLSTTSLEDGKAGYGEAAVQWWEGQYVPMSLVIMSLFVIMELILIGVASDEASAESQLIQWQWMFLYLLFFGGTAEYARNAIDFYSGGSLMLKDEDQRPKTAFSYLSLSAFISWVFAKSVNNASTLGAAFGWVGGIAYACYYTSFLSAALTIAQLRGQGFDSLPAVIFAKYGRSATMAFLLAIIYRLFNEVWSNTAVVAGFYGEVDSSPWWAAVTIGGLIPAGYVLMGGLRTSIYSDVAQAIIAIVLLLIVVGGIFSSPGSRGLIRFNPVPTTDMWSLEGGFDLVIVALLQGLFSYPFFDPVLTDRAFLSSVKVMVPAFIFAGTLGAAFIFLFSFLGIYGAKVGVGGSPQKVALELGPSFFSLVSLIMITSSLSTLDSTFSSTAKALGLEALSLVRGGEPKGPLQAKEGDLLFGRIAIILMLVVGTLPLLGDVVVLNATTVSGTVVMGLGPPVIGGIFFGPGTSRIQHTRMPLAFHLSFWCGVGWGAAFQADIPTTAVTIGSGKYAQLLGFNLYGLISCTVLYFIGLGLHAFVLPVFAIGESNGDANEDVEHLELSKQEVQMIQDKEEPVEILQEEEEQI